MIDINIYEKDGKDLVDLIGLEGMEVHEILEKLAFSLKRKHERNIKFGDLNTKKLSIYPLVTGLRPYFSKNYGLSTYVDELLETIDEELENENRRLRQLNEEGKTSKITTEKDGSVQISKSVLYTSFLKGKEVKKGQMAIEEYKKNHDSKCQNGKCPKYGEKVEIFQNKHEDDCFCCVTCKRAVDQLRIYDFDPEINEYFEAIKEGLPYFRDCNECKNWVIVHLSDKNQLYCMTCSSPFPKKINTQISAIILDDSTLEEKISALIKLGIGHRKTHNLLVESGYTSLTIVDYIQQIFLSDLKLVLNKRLLPSRKEILAIIEKKYQNPIDITDWFVDEK